MAEQLQVDRTTLTRNLSLLQARGWIAKSSGPDRRVRMISLSEDGLAALEEASQAWLAAQDVLLKRLGDSRYRKLMADLDALEESLS